MSTTIAKACLFAVVSTTAALAFGPVAQADPDRQCYQTLAGHIYCIDLSASAYIDCYLVPQGPRCPPTLPERDGWVQLSNGEWALPMPEEQWPPPSQVNNWPDRPPEGEEPKPVSGHQQPPGAPSQNWDYFPVR